MKAMRSEAQHTRFKSYNTDIVLRKDTAEDAHARKMAEFILSEAGQACLERADCGKLHKIIRFSRKILFLIDKVWRKCYDIIWHKCVHVDC